MISLRKKSTPLLKITMVHAIPGRVRLNCRALGYLGAVSKDIEDELNKMDFVKLM